MPTLETERLTLRPLRRTDAPEFTRLAGDWGVASMTSDIPTPPKPKARLAHPA
jgi:RimJ/RimL family protein N-acetyltransferase